ncbi:MAG: dihydrofolate reductase, partial [Eudoraea sp.]|nr:dihydrofolate reductase [Eudoraea sp.]
MRISQFLGVALALTLALSCKKGTEAEKPVMAEEKGFEYVVDQFADLRILRYQVPGFDELSLNEKKLVYYLTEAGLAGRDIMWDQNYRHNLEIRVALENVYTSFAGDKSTDDWKEFEIYLKRVWFSNGIHHHYSNDKLKPGFNADYLTFLLKET